MSTTSEDTPKRMGKQKKGDHRLDASRFQAPGISYKGKLIGLEDVPGPRGDMMCQVAMAKVKAAVKTIGEHKLKIVLNISLDGIRIAEEKSESILYFHPVMRISFISRDPGDSRAFGYVYGREDGSHQFYGIKTEKVAENAVLNLRDLFQIVYEMKKQEKEELLDSFDHDSQSTSFTVVKGPNTRNGLEQLNVYSSSISTLSSSHKASSIKDSPPSHDSSIVGASQSGFQRGIQQHRSSEIKQSFVAGKRSHLRSARQYSSMTASERHKLQPSVAGSSTPACQQSTSESTRTSSLTKLQHQHSSIESCDWFPPEDSGGSLARQTAGLDASAVNETSAEGWAVFETGEQSSSVLLPGTAGCGIIEGVNAEAVGKNAEGMGVQTSDLPPHSGETCMDSEAEKCSVDSGKTIAVEVKKVPFPKTSNISISGSEKASESPVDVVNCTFYSHLESGGLSPKLPGIPKLASSESLSDQVAEEEKDDDEHSTSVAEFSSPDAPPPPLPLDVSVDCVLQPPAVPPRPPVFEFAASRCTAELTESPIYGNISAPESASFSSSTLPRPRPLQSNRDLVSARVRPIQAGYDLTMPRPRPDPNLADLRPRDDLALNESRTFARPRLVQGETLSVCQNEKRNEITFQNPCSANSQCSRVEESSNTASTNRNVHGDPFAICLLSKGTKPHTVVSMSSAANDYLIHTSISPIPRPRPRQRSVPGASRDSGASVASASESPIRSAVDTSSPFQNSVTDDVIQLNPRQLNHPLSESLRSEPSGNCPSPSGRNAESLSSKVAKVPIRVHKESLGSSCSNMTPDPFLEVDPFATDSFSDDPFSSQPDPFSFESPSSDPFSKEFPSKALFYTRVVTVETGDVFDDTASSCGSDKKTAPESIVVRRSVRVSCSDSAMERKDAILLEKASGDSTAVESQRPDLPPTADQRSQKQVQSFRRYDDPTVCGESGNVVWESDENVEARWQISASRAHTQLQ